MERDAREDARHWCLQHCTSNGFVRESIFIALRRAGAGSPQTCVCVCDRIRMLGGRYAINSNSECPFLFDVAPHLRTPEIRRCRL